MREANEMGVISPFGGLPADNMRGPGIVSRINPSVRSAASGSARGRLSGVASHDLF